MPPLPDMHGIAALALTGLALFLFTRDKIPLETSSLLILITLIVGFEVFPYERDGLPVKPALFFLGFGHEALITIAALMMAGKALETTGALQPLASYMARAWAARPGIALITTLIIGAFFSAFVNNTPIVIMLMPMLISVALRAKISSTGILMPMGLATLLGGMATTIGTSTNLLVVGIAVDLGQRRLEMFDFLIPALFAGLLGLLFLWFVAPRLLPERETALSDTSPRIFNAFFHVVEKSYANGRTLSEILAKTNNLMKVTRIQRGDGLFVAKLPSVRLQVGDRLLVSDTRENLKDFERQLAATLYGETDVDHPITAEHPLKAEGQQLAEVVVTRGSPLHQRTLESTRFTGRYKLVPLAIHRTRTQSTDITSDLGSIRLRAGDVLLVQGTRDRLNQLKEAGTMLVLDGTMDLPHTRRAPRAVLIMGLIIAAAATGLLPISVSAVTGVGLLLLTRCISWRDGVAALSIPIVLLIVASLGLGHALIITGAADYLAQLFIAGTSGLSVPFVLSGLMLLMAILTNLVSNNAAGVIGTPIAISIAQQLGVSPEPFVLAVLFGANMSYATPIGYQTNLLIMSGGGYRYKDFLKVGIPLTIVVWLGFSFILPLIYGL